MNLGIQSSASSPPLENPKIVYDVNRDLSYDQITYLHIVICITKIFL